MIGDLLEPGEWATCDPSPSNLFRKSSVPMPGMTPTTALTVSYRALVGDAFGVCLYMYSHHSLGRIGRCMLPSGHATQKRGIIDVDGRRHRIYLFSARDSAAMLAGMRRKLEQP